MCYDFNAGIWWYRPVWKTAGWSFPWPYWASHQRKVQMISLKKVLNTHHLLLFNGWLLFKHTIKKSFCTSSARLAFCSKQDGLKTSIISYICVLPLLLCVLCVEVLGFSPHDGGCAPIWMPASLSEWSGGHFAEYIVCTNEQGHLSEPDYEKFHGCKWLQNCSRCGGYGTSGRSI